MSPTEPLLPAEQVVGILARHLRALGFMQVERRRGTRYLRLPNFPMRLRLSDHYQSKSSRARYYLVTAKTFVCRPRPRSELYLLAVEIAVGYIAACRARAIVQTRKNIKPRATHSSPILTTPPNTPKGQETPEGQSLPNPVPHQSPGQGPSPGRPPD